MPTTCPARSCDAGSRRDTCDAGWRRVGDLAVDGVAVGQHRSGDRERPASGLQSSVPSLAGWFLLSQSATSWVVVVPRRGKAVGARQRSEVGIVLRQLLAVHRVAEVDAPWRRRSSAGRARKAVMMAMVPRSSSDRDVGLMHPHPWSVVSSTRASTTRVDRLGRSRNGTNGKFMLTCRERDGEGDGAADGDVWQPARRGRPSAFLKTAEIVARGRTRGTQLLVDVGLQRARGLAVADRQLTRGRVGRVGPDLGGVEVQAVLDHARRRG